MAEPACEGDEPEVESLYDHAELGRTVETVIDLSAQITFGIAEKGNDQAP